MTKIVGKNDGENGRNEHYDIGSRKDVPRRTAVSEVKKGLHPDAHVIKAVSDTHLTPPHNTKA